MDILQAAAAVSASKGERSSPEFDAAAFGQVIMPFVLLARSRLCARVEVSPDLLASQALITLEYSLLRLLSSVCAQALALRFSLFRFRQTPVYVQGGDDEAPAQERRELYEAFVTEELRPGGSRLFAEYPALAALVESCVNGWVDANTEFLQRLSADRGEISTLLDGGGYGPVTAIDTGLSDRHNNGRTVMTLQFVSGLRVVYKPKDLGAEEAYFSILQWFNRHGAPLEFRAVRVLRRKGYGWAEFVDKRPCESVEQAHRYYRRAGHLLCVCYVLAGSDCHFDNLIASGEHPVLVDGEMLFQPAFAGRETTNNVLRTGLLPRPAAGTEDFSGLGCVADRGMPLRIPEWLGPNSDAMSLRFRPATIQPRSNVPFLGDTPLSPHDYVEDMVRGFQEMYACVLANRMHLLAPEGPLAAMAAQQVRVLLRGTPEYLLAMSAALHPQRLRRHGLPDVPLEAFPPARAALAPFGRFELSALQQMDVPRFLVPASSTGMFFRDDFENDGLEIPGCFSQSGLERVMVGIRGLDQADMARQTGLIRMAWSFASLSRMASE